MAEEFEYDDLSSKKVKKRYILHIVLFLATLITTIIAGTQWAMKDPHEISNWIYGIQYSLLILAFLTAHEFGHYFASLYHKVDATLPFYIPVPIPDLMFFGTFGAVIKTHSPIPNRKALFDIGASGPIAGFIVAFIILLIGFIFLPDKNTIYQFHPDYIINNGYIPNTGLHFGDNLLFYGFKYLFASPDKWIPPMNEIYHYPFLCVGWFGMFVTALNLIPIGQLDGGHIFYAMFGKKQHLIAKIFWILILLAGFGALFNILREYLELENNPNTLIIFLQDYLLPILRYINSNLQFIFWGWGGWLFWAIITRIVIKLPHPEIHNDEPIGLFRHILGWICIIILILTFSFNGIYIAGII
jgi:membrane-associated protease RseP (regulator of RpoE activity)